MTVSSLTTRRNALHLEQSFEIMTHNWRNGAACRVSQELSYKDLSYWKHLEDNALPEAERQREQEHGVNAEYIGRLLWYSSASPVRYG